MSCSFGALEYPLCSPGEVTIIIRILRALSIGYPLSNVLVIIKSCLLCIIWLFSSKVHNDFSKNYVFVLALPIVAEVLLNISLSLVDIISRFPDMTTLELLYFIHSELESMIRKIFVISTIVFLCLLLLAFHNRTYSKRIYKSIFFLSTIITVAFNIFIILLPFWDSPIEQITFISDVVICIIFLLSFLTILLVLLLRRLTTKKMEFTRHTMKWTMSFIIFSPILLLDFLNSTYWDIVKIVDKIFPILLLSSILLFLPSYRNILKYFCCSTSRKILPEGTLSYNNNRLSVPVVIYSSNISELENNITENQNTFYSYLQDINQTSSERFKKHEITPNNQLKPPVIYLASTSNT